MNSVDPLQEMSPKSLPEPERRRRLAELAKLFTKLGFLGFGGPAVHIAMMRDEVVQKKHWMDDAHFLDLVGATNLIPGPNSTEMTMHVGRERAGWRGLIVAGSCFILPAVCMTALIAWAYKNYGTLPEVRPFIYGITPAILAVLVVTMLRLMKTAVKSWQLAVLGVLALLAVLAGYHEVLVLFGSGLMGMLWLRGFSSFRVYIPVTLLQVMNLLTDINTMRLFFIFLKIGSILYGSGYVLFAFLDAELVSRGWLEKQQLIDAIAVGQFTPGPVFSSATFIGWQLGGASGAAGATVGIFLPAFLFVALLNPLVRRLRQSIWMSAFLDAVNVASIAIILAVVAGMAMTSVRDYRTMIIAAAGFIVMWRWPRLNTAYIVLGGSILGFLLSRITW